MNDETTELAVVEAVFDAPAGVGPTDQCTKMLPNGARCSLRTMRKSGRCHVHPKQRDHGHEKKVSTTVYLRRDQYLWLRGVSDAAGVPLAAIIRQSIDDFRRNAERGLGPGESIVTGEAV